MTKTKTQLKLMRIFVFVGVILLSSFYAQAQKKITLDEALLIAFSNSPDIKKSKINMEQNKERLNARLASLRSQFSFDFMPISYNKTESYDEYFSKWNTSENKGAGGTFTVLQPIKLTDGRLSLQNEFGYQDNYSEASNSNYSGFNNSLYLQYDQPLFTYNKTKMDLTRNELNLENATLSYSIEMLNIERQVNEAFYSIYQKQMALKIAEEEFENQKVSKDIIISKVEGGLSAKEELYQAELNFSTSQSNLDNKRVDLENAKDQFKLLLGISLYEDVAVSTDIKYIPVIVDLEKAIQNGLSQRLELTQKQIDLNNAKFDLIQTSSINEFKGNVSLSIGIMGNNEKLADVYDKPTKSPRAGITFSIPIFDWGERKAQIRTAELEIESREIDMNSLKNNITINIRKIYRNLKNQIQQIEIAEQNQKNAERTYDINLERYKNGDLTSIDLERFQNQLSEKKMTLANSLISYKLELLNLKIQSLWDFENNRSFVPQELQDNLIKN
ncbi:TolC family protein [Labilibaculum sp. DW002]|uniref:TolC family protein n=1 Tax=Paralabilibaculum antarcticum TaxID=2912572 RepID=A0ABT5VVI3_9BACT|nr:TolC family protein [Labilibaculum sp. DW002]MDE5419311.1 TolC family protein [Labilibaculum sp. DW002]